MMDTEEMSVCFNAQRYQKWLNAAQCYYDTCLCLIVDVLQQGMRAPVVRVAAMERFLKEVIDGIPVHCLHYGKSQGPKSERKWNKRTPLPGHLPLPFRLLQGWLQTHKLFLVDYSQKDKEFVIFLSRVPLPDTGCWHGMDRPLTFNNF